MRLFDAHCHLQDERLASRLDEVMARAAAAGVQRMMCCASAEEDWAKVAAIARRFPQVVPSFGLHPWHVGTRSSRWLETLNSALYDIPSGVGEIGLDHDLEPLKEEDQERAFLAQLNLSRQMKRPVSIHCRRAWGRLLELLERFGRHEIGFVLHSYSASADLVPRFAKLGAYFSFSGSITRDSAARVREVAAIVPLDRLLIETDAPDLMPASTSGGLPPKDAVNEPANLARVLKRLALVLEAREDELAERTWENASRLFQNAMSRTP